MRGIRGILAVAVAVSLCVASFASAQFGRNSLEAHLARPDSFDGQFHYCRAVFRPNPRGDGGSWLTDYPLADIDLSIRLSELTKTRVSFDGGGQPNHLIVQLTERRAVSVPGHHHAGGGQVAVHPGGRGRLEDLPAEGRLSLGGRLLGLRCLGGLGSEIRKVFPATDHPIVDVPRDHPMFHMLFDLDAVPQFPASAPFSLAVHRSAARTATLCTHG